MQDAAGMPEKPFSSHAKEIFSDSLITGVPNIATAESYFLKLFKLFVLVFCTVGCVYQITLFIQVLLTFPYIVITDIVDLSEVDEPAYTICSNNGLKRRLFCEKYPEKCEPVDEDICERQPRFCDAVNGSLEGVEIPKMEYRGVEETVSFEELVQMSQDLIKVTDLHNKSKKLTGPFPADNQGDLRTCYGLNYHINTNVMPNKVEDANDDGFVTIQRFTFYVQREEVFFPSRTAGIFLSIHSPYAIGYTFDGGLLMEPGRHYDINLHVIEEVLLKSPFATDCIDYIDLWERRGKTGARTELGCSRNCRIEHNMKSCKCNSVRNLDPYVTPFCYQLLNVSQCSKGKQNEEYEKKLELCLKTCKRDCRMYRYKSVVKDIEIESDKEGTDSTIEVEVNLFYPMMRLRMQPQYQSLEIVSYLGGFLGAWVGVSILTGIDFVESLVKIGIVAVRLRKEKQLNHSYPYTAMYTNQLGNKLM